MQNQTATLPSFEDCGLAPGKSEKFKRLALATCTVTDDGDIRQVATVAEGAHMLDFEQSSDYFYRCVMAVRKQERSITQDDKDAILATILEMAFDPANLKGLQFLAEHVMPGATLAMPGY